MADMARTWIFCLLLTMQLTSAAPRVSRAKTADLCQLQRERKYPHRTASLPHSDPVPDGGNTCDDFRKEADDVMSQCPFVRHIWSSRQGHMTLAYCLQEACKYGGNVVNYLPANRSVSGVAECQPRFCDRLGLMPTHVLGGWDVWRRHIFTSCRKSGFRQEFRKSTGVYSDCAHLGMPDVTSFQDCMQKTCDMHGTVFNFRTTATGAKCAIKLCDFNGLHVVEDRGGWDVYHSQIMRGRCEDRFIKLYDKSMGVASSCILKAWSVVGSAPQCAHLACEHRANVYNYKDRACYVESCRSPLLKPADRQGWQIYTSGI